MPYALTSKATSCIQGANKPFHCALCGYEDGYCPKHGWKPPTGLFAETKRSMPAAIRR